MKISRDVYDRIKDAIQNHGRVFVTIGKIGEAHMTPVLFIEPTPIGHTAYNPPCIVELERGD